MIEPIFVAPKSTEMHPAVVIADSIICPSFILDRYLTRISAHFS